MFFFLALPFLMMFVSSSALAREYDCQMNGKIKINGASMNVFLRLDISWFGYGAATSGSYRYEVENGAIGEGRLACSEKDQHKEQRCRPTVPDAILEEVLIVPMVGPMIQVHGQAPTGVMSCKQSY